MARKKAGEAPAAAPAWSRDFGKAARAACPRSSHAALGVRPEKRDPVALIEQSNRDRLENLVPMRHTRMMESPFAFYRGTALIQAHDLAGTPSSGITVQACGDCHLLNFGGFATPERNLIFDLNDFDETHPGPWEWDLKRLVASLVLAARWRSFDKATAEEAVGTAVAAYRDWIASHAGDSTLDTWYARITWDDLRKSAKTKRATSRIEAYIDKARTRTSEHVFHRITRDVGGRPRIVDEPPLLFHSFPGLKVDIDKVVPKFLGDYGQTLRDDHRALFERFEFVDAAIKVVGVGSVGTRCFVALMMDRTGHPLFLQVKEARPSVLAGYVGQKGPRHHGERIVTGQRLMQAASDIFLGWTRGPGGRDFYIRQLRDMKIAVEVTELAADGLCLYAGLCGRALARAHAKAGAAAAISGYIGSGQSFIAALTRYALGYADQVEQDYEAFRLAVRAGRLPGGPTPSDLEQQLR
ncbi:MAG: DUF2252 domain-containing protein [Alphaproteobacteria bacterium]|jgi:uncharacterized protein (DUF2252 family)|nr:DUF2252 domain-containing protein [Alphaproteobacteria bacterium]